MRLLHVSDTHLTAPGVATSHPELDPAAHLDAALAAAADHGPFDAVVVTGDICDDGSVAAAQAVLDRVRPLAPVVLGVPGNHDLGESVHEVFGMPSAQLGAWRLVGVPTQVEGEVAGVADAALAEVDELDDQPTVLLMHHPLRSRSTHAWFSLARGELLAERVERHRAPLVILSGHTHEAFEGQLGTAHLLGAPSTFYGIAHSGDTWALAPLTAGVRVVGLGEDGSVSSTVVLSGR